MSFGLALFTFAHLVLSLVRICSGWLEAFDTLFNKRDYAATERYRSPNYIQHSAHIELDRDGLSTSSKGFRLR